MPWSSLALLALLLPAAASAAASPPFQRHVYEDGHARPRAVVYNPADRLLYVALSTANIVALVDPGPGSGSGPGARQARVVARVATGRFPQALALLPSGGVLVSCRFDAELGVIEPGAGPPRYRRLPAGAEHGHRGLAAHPGRPVAYVASPPAGGVKVVSLEGRGVVQSLPTGASPRSLLLIDDPRGPAGRKLLLVANFIGHTVTAHPVEPDGRLAAAIQTVTTDAPVQEMLVVPLPTAPTLLLLTHEDRPLDRAAGPVHGLDSVVLALPLQGAGPPLSDPGPGRRRSYNLTERSAGLLAKLDALAYDGARRRLAIAGAASDNVLLTDLTAQALPEGEAVQVGLSPVALAFLPDGRLAAADRLSDTLSLIGPRGVAQVVLGRPERRAPAELGELLFYGRALVPNNVADGPLSVYACSACHDDAHVDGRRHPARRNRFRSMTKTCRAVTTTAPYLSLGELRDLPDFADNILSSHAQGEAEAPGSYDQYPVALRVRVGGAWGRRTLSPQELRQAMAAYLATIPGEPSPFVPPGATALSDEARRGLALFLERCGRCHQPVGNTALGNRVPQVELERRLLRGEVALSSPARFDVGTPVLGQGGNNPPSLRGVWDAAPYLSDGSAATLEALLQRTDPDADQVHAPGNALPAPRLPAAERAALLAFLRSL